MSLQRSAKGTDSAATLALSAGSAGSGGGGPMAPDEIDFPAIMELMTSKYTVELVDRHVAAIRRVCKTCCNGFLLKHLESLVTLLGLAVDRIAQGHWEFAAAVCDMSRVASQPFVSCKASDMITYGHLMPAFIKALVNVLAYALPPAEDQPLLDDEARRAFEDRRAMCEQIRIEVAHTLACWSRFGLDEDTVELCPNQPLIQAVADSGTPNLRILRQSQVMDALAACFRAEDSPEAIVVTLGAIRDMSLYRPLARQITNSGLISNLVHVIRVNLLGSDVLLVAVEVIWNVLELDWEAAAESLGQEEVMESFRDFMDAVLSRGYRFKDKIFRNDLMVLLMYMSKRVENRPLFAKTGLMAMLVSHAVSPEQRKALKESGVLEELLNPEGTAPNPWPCMQGKQVPEGHERGSTLVLTNSQEDMEFRILLWATVARCFSSTECTEVAVQCGFVPSLLSYLAVEDAPQETRQWSQEQRRKLQLEALSALFLVVQHAPHAFLEARGSATVLQMLQTTRSREVQKKCLHLLQAAVRMGPEFVESLGKLGAVGILIELFTDKDNPMTSRQLCASVLAGLCSGNAENCREFRKKDGVDAVRAEVVYRPQDTTDNHLFYTLCVVDCVWCAVVGTRKNEIRFLDAGGLFALMDVLEVAPLLLKRQITGCLADLLRYRKAAKLFLQWNSQVTMKGGLKILLDLWQNEQEAAGNTSPDGVIWDLHHPLNPPPQEILQQDPPQDPRSGRTSSSSLRSSKGAGKLRQAVQQAAVLSSSQVTGQNASHLSADPGTGIPTSAALSELQDCRAKIYAVLSSVGFECQETLSIAERQQMELVKLYPEAVQLETWIEVMQNLQNRQVKPVGADRKWMQDSIDERKDQAARVQGLQQKLADERRNEDQASLHHFYEDIRVRLQLRRATSSGAGAQPGSAGPRHWGFDETGAPSSGDDTP